MFDNVIRRPGCMNGSKMADCKSYSTNSELVKKTQYARDLDKNHSMLSGSRARLLITAWFFFFKEPSRLIY